MIKQFGARYENLEISNTDLYLTKQDITTTRCIKSYPTKKAGGRENKTLL